MSEEEAIRVLVVDDEEPMRRSLIRVLGRRGVAVAGAAGTEAALELLEQGMRPHVVVSDFQMPPGPDGVELLAAVRLRWPRTRRILVTGFGQPEVLQRAINEAQVHRFLPKPWEPRALIDIVEEGLTEYDVVERLEALTGDLERQVEDRSRMLVNAKQEWLRTVDAIADPLTLITPDYVIQRANTAVGDRTGMPIQRINGQKCYEVVVGETEPCPGCPVPQTLETGGRNEGEVVVPDSGTVFRVLSYPVHGEAGWVRSVVCTYRDVTGERELQNQLLQSEKMAAVGGLAGGVAHEINNPLGGILAWTQLLLREVDPEGEQHGFLKEIEDSALRAKRIVQGLLNFARAVPAEERSPVQVNTVATDAIFLVESTLGKRRAAVDRDFDEDVREVQANANQIQQVLLNLLTNAYGATEESGHVRVRTRNTTGGEVLIQVEDDGHGIPGAVGDKVFQPFFTTKPQGEGTGLGLAISYGIVESHHGSLSFEPGSEGGTVFTVRLPAARRASGPDMEIS